MHTLPSLINLKIQIKTSIALLSRNQYNTDAYDVDRIFLPYGLRGKK